MYRGKMLSFTERQEFYKDTPIYLKDNTQWRFYEIQLENGKWKPIKNQIRNSEQLRTILIEESPINVFSSCSIWLNPLKIQHPHSMDDRLFLDNDVFIDIDHKNTKEVNKVIDWFEKNPRYQFINSVDSGNGVNLYYKDTLKVKGIHPDDRFQFVKEERQVLAGLLMGEGFDIDAMWIPDLDRISRVVGTLNDGEKPCKLIYDPRLGIGSERHLADETKTTSAEDRESARAEPSASSTLIQKKWCWNFIDAFVEGTKYQDERGHYCGRYCVFIRKDKSTELEKFIKRIKYLQRLYKLPDFYIYKTHNTYDAICPEAVQFKRVLKINKKIKAKNCSAFEKYHHYWIRTSAIKNVTDGTLIDEAPKHIETVYSNVEGHMFSRPHCDYLGIKPDGLLIGNPKNKIKMALMNVTTREDGGLR